MVHIHAEGPAFFCWIPKLFGKRVIVTIHGIDWQREKWQSGLGSKFIHQGEKNAAKYADEVIVLSKGVQDYFKETYAEIIDIKATRRKETELPIREVAVPKKFSGTDVSLGLTHKLKRVVYSISLAYTLKNILKHGDEKVVLHFHNQYNMFFFLKILVCSIAFSICPFLLSLFV